MTEENKYKVAIVDDDDFLVDMYVTKFRSSGIEVDSFKSGQALLDKLKEGYVSDAILLDIVMPGMTGIEVLREIRKQKLGNNIQIIMLTNQNEEKDLTEAKELGVNGYIVKSSITPSELIKEIGDIIKNNNSK